MLLARQVVASLLTALLIGVPTAAFADPPDPTWIAGYWDDDDFDDAVVAITTSSAVEGPPAVDAGAPRWIPVGRLDLPNEESRRVPVRSAVSPRAPPVDSPTHS